MLLTTRTNQVGEYNITLVFVLLTHTGCCLATIPGICTFMCWLQNFVTLKCVKFNWYILCCGHGRYFNHPICCNQQPLHPPKSHNACFHL